MIPIQNSQTTSYHMGEKTSNSIKGLNVRYETLELLKENVEEFSKKKIHIGHGFLVGPK